MKAKKVTDAWLKKEAIKSKVINKMQYKKEKVVDFTKETLPDGSRKYKMFKNSDEESAEAVELSRYLLRHIDKNMLDAIAVEHKDESGKVNNSDLVIYTRDDMHGDIIFTINAGYICKDEVEDREKNDSLNEGDSNNNSKED